MTATCTPLIDVAQVFPDLAHDVLKFPVRPGEQAWAYEEIEHIATGLLDDVQRLSAELTAAEQELLDLMHSPGESPGDDLADSGSRALEREQTLTLVNNLRDILAQTQRAVERIKDGSYAQCEVTGSPIGKARLQAFPRATLSLEAKAREERRH